MSTAGFPVTNGVVTLLSPPEGYEVDFDNPRQQKVLEHYLVFGIAGPLAFIALCQRYYTKICLSKGLQVDDGFMFLGWLASIVTQAMLVRSIVDGGMCAHAWEMPLWKFQQYSVTTYVTAPIFMLCNGFCKLSLLTFYLHLSPVKWFRYSVWSSIVLVSAYTLIITFMMFFQCSPIDKAFDPTVANGTCLNAGILYMATAVSNIITDLILFVLPIPMVYRLHMPIAQKIGAIIIFGIGSVTIGTSVVRLSLLPPVLQSLDPSWDAAPANIWTFVEANLFVICGSMPTLRKFFKHVAPRIMGSSASRSYVNSYGPGQSTGAGLSRSRKPRRQYSQFPDEENEMDTFRGDSPPGAKGGVAVASVAADAPGDGDAHSEKAILQTKSFTVQYE